MSPATGGTEVRVGVVGGGISGLSAAYFLHRQLPQAQVVLWEASARLGGALHTQRVEGYCVEAGADMFITVPPWAVELCKELGVELVGTNPQGQGAYVVHRGQVVAVPEGFAVMMPTRVLPLLSTPLLSWKGKLRLLAEPLIPPRQEMSDESLASFAIRRLGQEAFERLVQPLVAGIYAADARRLSMQAALGRFVQMERRWGSLAAAWWHTQRDSFLGRAAGARYGLFVAPRKGMSGLIQHLADALPPDSVQLNAPVLQIRPYESGWQVQLPNQQHQVDALVLALPAWQAARLVKPWAGKLAQLLQSIPYGSAAVVCAAVEEQHLEQKPRGFGFVVPECEGRRILAASFSSVKFPHRAPQGGLLVRIFIGGSRLEHLLELPDDQLAQVAWDEVASLCRWKVQPRWIRVYRWDRAMAQYHVGHLERVHQIRQELARWPRLALAGNAYEGVGVPYCIHSAQQAAQRLAQALQGHKKPVPAEPR